VSIHRVNPNEALSVERYMNTVEFAELNGISGLAVARRCALLVGPSKRELLWFIQGLSLQTGGLRQLAKELLEMFPERIVRCAGWQCGCEGSDGTGCDKLSLEQCLAIALGRHPRQQAERHRPRQRRGLCLEEFFIDLCVNPRLGIRMPGEAPGSMKVEQEMFREEFPELDRWQVSDAGLAYFQDIIGALVGYKERYEQQAREEFCQTAISTLIWKSLGETLKSGTMTLIDGKEGRGKTESALAFVKCHLGACRYVSFKGATCKKDHFRVLARAVGVLHSRWRSISAVQAEVEEIARLSGLMLVLDEAHYLFQQGARSNAWPQMLDWVGTALCNPPLPVALVSTPQFLSCVEHAVRYVGWNFRQFKRRCKRCVALPESNSAADIENVARHMLPYASGASIKLICGYAALGKRDLSGLGDIVREAKLIAEQEGADKVTWEHLQRARDEVLLPGDAHWAAMEQRLQRPKARGRGQPTAAPAPAPGPEIPVEETAAFRGASPRSGQVLPSLCRERFLEPSEVLVGDIG